MSLYPATTVTAITTTAATTLKCCFGGTITGKSGVVLRWNVPSDLIDRHGSKSRALNKKAAIRRLF
jgi:hypothetical protein